MPSDAPGFARCQMAAYREDKVYQIATGMKPDSTPEMFQENLDYRIKRWQLRLAKPNIHWTKAVDEGKGEIVGISGWEEPEARQLQYSRIDDDFEWPPM